MDYRSANLSHSQFRVFIYDNVKAAYTSSQSFFSESLPEHCEFVQNIVRR